MVTVPHGFDDSKLGDMMHHILYHFKSPEFDTLLRQNLACYGVERHFNMEKIRKTRDHLVSFTDELGPAKVYRELAMEVKTEEGQVYRAEADLVLEGEHELTLIDYKSFPGVAEQVFRENNPFYAGKYAGQLAAYKKMLEHTFPGKQVKQCLIFYVIQGLVVKLKV